MPNGFKNDAHYAEIIAGYDAFFAPLAEIISSFAQRHNLGIEKYYHDSPCWQLRFSHPHGGSAHIELCRRDDSTLSVSGVWWIDEYDTSTCSLRSTIPVHCVPIGTELEEMLDTTFKSTLGFTTDDPARVVSIGNAWHRTWTREQFEKQQRDNRYPQPTS